MPVTITPKDEIAKQLVATPEMTALMQACAFAKLWGDLSLTTMRNYSKISSAENVRTLRILAACRDGVALLFPSPSDPRGIGALLRIEKHVEQLALSPSMLYRMLLVGLRNAEVESVDDVPSQHAEEKTAKNDLATRVRGLERRQSKLPRASKEYLQIERELGEIKTRLEQEIAEMETLLARLTKKKS